MIFDLPFQSLDLLHDCVRWSSYKMTGSLCCFHFLLRSRKKVEVSPPPSPNEARTPVRHVLSHNDAANNALQSQDESRSVSDASTVATDVINSPRATLDKKQTFASPQMNMAKIVHSSPRIPVITISPPKMMKKDNSIRQVCSINRISKPCILRVFLAPKTC